MSTSVNKTSTSSANKSSGASSMAELMAKHSTSVKAFHRGDRVEGTITKLTSSQILVDIGGKSEAVVLEKEKKNVRQLMTTLKVGDKVTVGVLTPESDAGVPVVSLRYFMEDKSWDELEKAKKNQTPLEVTVREITKGGIVVETKEGMSGFLPQSHVQFTQQQQIAVGKMISLQVLELDRKENRIIFSQKSAISDAQLTEIAKKLSKGTKLSGQVVSVTNFGLFVTLPINMSDIKEMDGLVHISEISWDKVTDLSSLFSVGQNIEVVVLGVDKEAGRVDLSIKQLTTDPFAAIAEKYPVDKKVKGTVMSVDDGNITVDLGDSVEAVIRKEKVPPTMSFKPGDSVNATVSEVDPRRRRLSLVPILMEKPIGYR